MWHKKAQVLDPAHSPSQKAWPKGPEIQNPVLTLMRFHTQVKAQDCLILTWKAHLKFREVERQLPTLLAWVLPWDCPSERQVWGIQVLPDHCLAAVQAVETGLASIMSLPGLLPPIGPGYPDACLQSWGMLSQGAPVCRTAHGTLSGLGTNCISQISWAHPEHL